MAIMNFAILFWPLQELSRDIANLAIFSLLIFNVLALKFLYSCFAPKENCTEAEENTLEGLIFSLMDKETENISLESLLSWRNCLKDKSLALFSGILSLVIFIVYLPSSRVAFYFIRTYYVDMNHLNQWIFQTRKMRHVTVLACIVTA